MRLQPGLGRRQRIVAWLAACIAISCGTPVGADDVAQTKAVLTGIVVDESEKPVAGVTVSATSWEKVEPVKSQADGTFRVDLPFARTGWVHATLLVRGEDGALGVRSVSGERPEPVKIILKPARALTVRVCDRDGGPVEGAEVHFLMAFHQLAQGRTDAAGRWHADVPEDAERWGVYALKSKTGFDYALAERARGSTEPPLPLPDRLTLTLDGARTPLRVKSVDRDGKPLAGVAVGPWLIQKPGHEAQMNGMTDAFSRTGEDGVATLDWLPERVEGGLSIVSRSSSYYSPDHATWLRPEEPVDEVTITHLPYERLSGRVTTPDGRPAAGVTLAVEGHGGGDQTFHGAARTDADGRYSLQVYAEQAYIITAAKDDQIAPYRSGVVVRAGKPVEGVDLRLGRATRVRGRVTVGPDHKPVAGTSVQAVIDKGSIPAELKRPGDRFYRGMAMHLWKQTGEDGRFEFRLGPGEYTIQGPARVEPVKIEIAAEDPPAEIVRDFAMPRPETGPFRATVVDADGQPVQGAVVEGTYAGAMARGWFHPTRTNDQGTFAITRSLDPMVVHAETPDRSRGGVARIEAEATEARIVVRPTASATGRLVDPEGKPFARRKLSYGIRIYQGPAGSSPFSWNFGGSATTDDEGRFSMAGLVVGESYEIYIYQQDDTRISTARMKATPTDPTPVALGDVTIDLSPPRAYVPPTPARRASESFAARKEMSAREKLDFVLTEARREYTRPLLLFGVPDDPACVDLFRRFEAASDDGDEGKGKPRVKSPGALRWEFELASLDTARADVQALAKGLGVSAGDWKTPLLAVLSEAGTLTATYPLRLGSDKALDARALGAFLHEHTLPRRDAKEMLAEGLARAKAEDRRVFLIMSASWCGPCRLLARYLVASKAELEPHYVFVKLDISRDAHADALRRRFKESESGGIPWYAILDASGKPLITSNAKELEDEGPNTNIGFPSSKEGIDHFLEMLRQTAPRLSEAALAALRERLSSKP